MISIIRNKKEFEDFYFYSKDQIKEDYPSQYPCICKQVDQGGGLGGEWIEHVIVYAPYDNDTKSYLNGVQKGWET